MKSHFANALKLTMVAAGLLMAIGCASMVTGQSNTLRLKIVDAKTGDPVPAVSAVWREDLDNLLFGHFETGPTNLPPSDNGGFITISGVKDKMTGRLILSCDGYTTEYGVYSNGSLQTSDNIQPLPIPQDLFTLDDAENDARVNGCFVIRIHK